jgi:hypothetical protein
MIEITTGGIPEIVEYMSLETPTNTISGYGDQWYATS